MPSSSSSGSSRPSASPEVLQQRRALREEKIKRNIKLGFLAAIVVIGIFVFSVCANRIFETVEAGTYHIKQAAITGKLTGYMKPGLYWQNFGDIKVWPIAETYYFTQDPHEGQPTDQSVEVRFNDGSMCNVSGTVRVNMPTSSESAISLIDTGGYRDFKDLEEKMLQKIVRNSLNLTANLMTARESYSEKRPDFVYWASDQISNGLYQTEEVDVEVDAETLLPITEIEAIATNDSKTSESQATKRATVHKKIKVIKKGKDGLPLRQDNPLEDMGISFSNFEIKGLIYDDRVKNQISQQQEALMAVATARAQAEKAEQDAKTSEAKGKAAVMEAKYMQETIKEKAVVEATQIQEVAEIKAEQERKVAEIGLKAAELKKETDIALGEGEAARKKAVLEADGALQTKLDAWVKAQEFWAKAFAERSVPSIVVGGVDGKNQDDQSSAFQTALMVKTLQDLNVDLGLKGGKQATPQP
jgi:regulator of protease activity HflC (stomatin/prohibitin superfamily)